MEGRLLDEFKDLNKRIAKLESFIEREEFTRIDEEQQDLMKEQLEVMSHYSGILGARILRMIKK